MRYRAAMLAIVAVAAAIGWTSIAFASPVTLSTSVTSVTTSAPSRCTANPCSFQAGGAQNSNYGGTGTYSIAGFLGLTPVGNCFTMSSSTATLSFSSGALVFTTDGNFCGTYNAATGTYEVTGPAVFASTSGTGFSGWTGNGTGTISGSLSPSGTPTFVITGLSVPLTAPVGSGGSSTGGSCGPVSCAATPELSSVVLVGSGGLGFVGYALLRRRGRRQSDIADAR